MKCHYEVLNVPRDADETEIKSAYKKLALKWHPDKNLENVEFAKEQFQLIQLAYDVLSDRQERAWYDNHREQILRGANSDYQDDTLDVFQYFTTTCFKGYNDEENGFYTVYRNVFAQIAKEDLDHIDDKDEFLNIPTFGDSASDYHEIVGRFYDYWTSYSTKKSYVWLDPYNIKDLPNRRILKLAEKENEKIRQKAKKERNEEVRNLVAFVRKRDKRVQNYTKQLEAKNIENRQKQERLSKQRRLERIKQLNESSEQGEWMRFDNVKSELEEIEKKLAEEFGEELSDSEESICSDELDNLYCIACNKVFKNPKAFKNHELSKKHRENIEKLKVQMTEEDEELNLNQEEIEEEDVSNIEDICNQNRRKKKKKNKKSKDFINQDDGSDESLNQNSPGCNETETRSEIGDDLYNGDVESVKIKSETKKKSNRKLNKKSNVQDSHVDRDHCCVTCKANFESKNKLFDHLKKTGHSVYIPPGVRKEKTKKKTVKEK